MLVTDVGVVRPLGISWLKTLASVGFCADELVVPGTRWCVMRSAVA